MRLISSSLNPLLNLVQVGQFNSSLFHRLNITPLEIPSLNKRRYDIPLLCDHFLKQENSLQKKSIILDSKCIRVLRNYNWFANIAQLKNLIKYIVNSCQDKNKVISETEILNYLEENKTNVIAEQKFTKFNSLKDAVNNFEKKFLLYLLKKNRYDIKQASSNINLSAMQLKDKLLKLNIDINSINKI
jgi:DNA-binding NtrC family response regulator